MEESQKSHQPHVEIQIESSIEPEALPRCSSRELTIKQSILSSILTRFHAGYFRISLSLCSQALLWKILGEPVEDSHVFRRVFRLLPSTAFALFWSIALVTLCLLSLLYILRCLFYFKMVEEEFSHRVGVNYLFAPWICWLLLLQSSPFFTPNSLQYLVLWWVLIIPIVVLDVKIYGQWFTKGKRFLSAVANPTSQLSVMGNLVGARAAAVMGWRESALSPSMASLAWAAINGGFDVAAKMLFFLSLFLFLSLVSRPSLFKKSMKKFNVAWWAYSFTVTLLALASVEYAEEVKGSTAHAIMFVLSALSVLVSLILIVITAINTNMLLPDSDPIINSTSNGTTT